jgi:hypothetical protein
VQAVQKPTSELGQGVDTIAASLPLIDAYLITEVLEYPVEADHLDIKINSMISNPQFESDPEDGVIELPAILEVASE